jgi:hypothetical protein
LPKVSIGSPEPRYTRRAKEKGVGHERLGMNLMISQQNSK